MQSHSLTSEEKILFARRLSLFLRAGIPIHTAFGLIREGTKRPSSIRLMEAVAQDVRAGRTLADALMRFPRIFDPLMVGYIRIGEASGALAEHASQVALLLQRRAVLTRTIISSAIYPVVIMSATLAVTLFLTLYAFPKMIPLFKGFHRELPFSTRALISATDLLAEYGWYLLIGLIAFISTLLFAQRFRRVRRMRDTLTVYLPFFGTMIRYYYVSTTARILSSLLERGVPLMVAIELAEQTIGHSSYKEALKHMGTLVSGGQRMSEGFASQPHLFPAVLMQLVGAGEITGTLPESLRTCAQIYEEYLEERSRTLSTLMEPILMICMGLVVGFVALAIITPIYGLTQGINLH